MGLLDWLKTRGKSEEAAKPSRTHSIFSDFPDRVLKTQADVKKDDAMLEMTLVVNEITNDPDTNWRKYKGDFEKAVTGILAPGFEMSNEGAMQLAVVGKCLMRFESALNPSLADALTEMPNDVSHLPECLLFAINWSTDVSVGYLSIAVNERYYC